MKLSFISRRRNSTLIILSGDLQSFMGLRDKKIVCYLSKLESCDGLVTHPGCTTPYTQRWLGMVQVSHNPNKGQSSQNSGRMNYLV